MKIGLLGTGNLAVTLGRAWASAGHTLVVSGRNPGHAVAAAEQIGAAAAAVGPRELAALADPALVPQAVAATLSVRMQPGQPLLDTLLQMLQPRQMLLVLDNCEHLSGACTTWPRSS